MYRITLEGRSGAPATHVGMAPTLAIAVERAIDSIDEKDPWGNSPNRFTFYKVFEDGSEAVVSESAYAKVDLIPRYKCDEIIEAHNQTVEGREAGLSRVSGLREMHLYRWGFRYEDSHAAKVEAIQSHSPVCWRGLADIEEPEWEREERRLDVAPGYYYKNRQGDIVQRVEGAGSEEYPIKVRIIEGRNVGRSYYTTFTGHYSAGWRLSPLDLVEKAEKQPALD